MSGAVLGEIGYSGEENLTLMITLTPGNLISIGKIEMIEEI